MKKVEPLSPTFFEVMILGCYLWRNNSDSITIVP